MKRLLIVVVLLASLACGQTSGSNSAPASPSAGTAVAAPSPARETAPPAGTSGAQPDKAAADKAKAEQKSADDQTVSPEYCLGTNNNLNSDSVADQISLYYFSDVSRLMRLLNPNTRKVNDSQLVQDAETKKRALLQAEIELTKKQSEVNRLQADLQQKEERLRQSEAHFALSQALFDKASANQTGATRNQTTAADRLNKAQKNADAHPDDASAAAELTGAKLAKDKADQQVEDSNKKQEKAKAENDAAQTQVNKDRDDQNGLAGDVEKAKKSLADAQTAVGDQRGQTLLAAADEMDAFTRARDNSAYWCAPGDKASDDPARRVTLSGFDDSKTIFLRAPARTFRPSKR